MLAIGRALMSKPKLLMLDEPTVGLQPTYVDRIFELMQQLNDEGLTVLLVEQNAYESLEIADFAYVLDGGQVRLSGPGQELLVNPLVKQAYLAI